MNIKRRTLALLSAAALGIMSANFSASALTQEIPPDWIPNSFAQAMQFENTYGKHHIGEDGLICCVRKEQIGKNDYEIGTDGSTANHTVISQDFYEFAMPEKPDKSDTKSYDAYLKALEELGLTEFEAEHPMSVGFRYEVIVYRPLSEGTLRLDWSAGFDHSNPNAVMEFDIAEGGTITQTDLSAWLPDSITEWEKFHAANKGVNIMDGYIVYCGQVAHDGGYQLYTEQNGAGRAELIQDYSVSRTTLTAFGGGLTNTIMVYKPLTPGKISLNFTEKREWETEVLSETTKYYEIGEDLSIQEISESAFEPKLMGDCNLDGKFSVTDIVMFQKWLLGDGTLASAKNVDMNDDSVVNVFDLAFMKKLLTEDKAMPLIKYSQGEVTPKESAVLYDMLERDYPDMDFSDFTFVHDPDHPLASYFNGKLFSIYYKDILLHGYGNINCDENVYAVVGKSDTVNFVVDPKLFTEVDTEQEILSGWDVLPTCIDTEEPELIIYVDALGENPPRLAYRAVGINGYEEHILDAVTGEEIIYIPYTVI
ncbi:MAG: dockerin type I repeat-containing protein [Oscillospiraceae bacterium]|nr:dockerin type I repeat-containing protein [Oscillospiraceae bacterium]